MYDCVTEKYWQILTLLIAVNFGRERDDQVALYWKASLQNYLSMHSTVQQHTCTLYYAEYLLACSTLSLVGSQVELNGRGTRD